MKRTSDCLVTFKFKERMRSRSGKTKYVVFHKTGRSTKTFRYILTTIIRGPILSTNLNILSRSGSKVRHNHGGHLTEKTEMQCWGRWKKKTLYDVDDENLLNKMLVAPLSTTFSVKKMRRIGAFVRFDFLFREGPYCDYPIESTEEELRRAYVKLQASDKQA